MKKNCCTSSTSHTQPFEIQQQTRKNRIVNKKSLGINLKNRHGTLEDENLNNIAATKENVLPSSSTQSYIDQFNHHTNEDADNSDFDIQDVNIEYSSEDDDEIDNCYMLSMFQEHQGYSDIGDPIIECHYCGALTWYQ
ncbi:hypothetical protein Lal_00037731 [Lupinus albus]|nr:hypothetical protein Lal_00037731 [Lupinus albus]